MQTTGNTALDTALADVIDSGRPRVVRHRVLIDWADDKQFAHPYSDVSELIDDISLDQATLQTDLPDKVNKLTGFSSNELTVKLKGKREGDNLYVSEWLSRYRNDGPFFNSTVTGRWVKYSVVEETPAGDVEIRKFTGILRDVQISRKTGEATLVAGDALIYNTSTVILPHWAKDTQANSVNWTAQRPINTSWVFEEIMRQCGTPIGPAARPNCTFYMSMNGSMLPSIGTLKDYTYNVSGESHGLIPASFNLMTQGKFGPTLASAPTSPSGVSRYFSHNLCRASKPLYVPANGTSDGPVNVGFTVWAYSDGGATRTIPAYNAIWYDGVFVGLGITRGSLPTDSWVQIGSNGQVYVKISDIVKNPRWSWPAQPAGWHAYNVLFKYRNNAIQVELRVDGVLQGSATQGEGNQSTGYVYGANSTPVGIPPTVEVVRYDQASHLQLYWDGGGTIDYIPGQDTPPTTVDGLPWADWTGCLSELDYIPDVTYENAWSVLQQIAEGEFAMLRIDEWGRPQYRASFDWHNTRTYSGVRTISVDHIEDMTTLPTFDQFATRVEMKYLSRSVVTGEAWSPNSPFDLYMPRGAVTQKGPFNPSKIVVRGTTTGTNVPGWSRVNVSGGGTKIPDWRGKSWVQSESYAGGVRSDHLTVDAFDPNRDGSTLDADTLEPTFFWSDDKREVVIQAATTNWPAGDAAVYYGAQVIEDDYGSATTPVPGILWSLKASVYSDEDESTYIEENPDAIAANGLVTLQLDKHDWRQGYATAAALAPLLLEDIANPVPLVKGLTIPMDQRLQHGDVVNLDPQDSFSSTVRAQVVGLRHDKFTTSVDLRLIATPSTWLLGVPGSSELSVTTTLG